MEELGLGPNGSLMYCMEYLLENIDWLEDELDKFDDDEYLILDCEFLGCMKLGFSLTFSQSLSVAIQIYAD